MALVAGSFRTVALDMRTKAVFKPVKLFNCPRNELVEGIVQLILPAFKTSPTVVDPSLSLVKHCDHPTGAPASHTRGGNAGHRKTRWTTVAA